MITYFVIQTKSLGLWFISMPNKRRLIGRVANSRALPPEGGGGAQEPVAVTAAEAE